jgi:poly(3-hydroxybutyrate) depolymerase
MRTPTFIGKAVLMRYLSPVVFAALVLALTTEPARAAEEPPRIRINYLAYPVTWNDKAIQIGARLQVPLDVTGKVPAVIVLHGTLGVADLAPARSDVDPSAAGSRRSGVARSDARRERVHPVLLVLGTRRQLGR